MTPEVQRYAEQFASIEHAAKGKSAIALLDLRRDALDRFRQLGFPTPKHEEWKYTNVAPIARTPFELTHSTDRPELRSLPFAGIAPLRLVFVNGLFVERLSSLDSLPDGAAVLSLQQAARSDYARTIESHLAHYARYQDQTFVAMNTAMFQDGGFIYLSRGSVVEQPIQLLFISAGNDDRVMSHPRNLIIAEESSQFAFVETYAAVNGGTYFTNAVTEIIAGDNAVIDHYKVELESESAYHIATTQIQQGRDSNFSSHSMSLGGALVRNDVNSVLGGSGIECTINGLYVGKGKQHIDNHTAIDHATPHCNSHELYKGILDDASTAVFNGKIFVRVGAQKTDAKQTNQNLLLSKEATVNTKPQLEIFADDVRCTHGATVGQLDEDAIFYLRSRGIGQAEARSLLTYAFASDIVGRIKIESLRSEVEQVVSHRLRSDAQHRGVPTPDGSR